MKNSSPTFDDLVFEGRNKAYGAYELRQLTDRHSAYGLFITMSTFAVMVLVGCLIHNRTEIIQTIGPIIEAHTSDVKVDVEKPQPPAPHQAATPPPVTPDVLVITDHVVLTSTQVPDIAPIQNPLPVQPTTLPASGTEGVIPSNTGTEGTPLTASNNGVTGTITHNTIEKWAEVMPSFVGGENALREYLATRIKMHPLDIENGVNGKVVVRFYVDIDGTVKGATVVKDTAGGHCAEVALKVINKMPKWNPGMQNNLPVRVYYNIPITFEVK